MAKPHTREEALNCINSAEIDRIVIAQLHHGDAAAENECRSLRLWDWQIPFVLQYVQDVLNNNNPYQLPGNKIF